MEEPKLNISIVTLPISRAGLAPLSQLVKVIEPLANSISLVTGDEGFNYFKNRNRIQLYNVNHKRGSHIVTRIIRYIAMQFRVSLTVWKLSHEVQYFIFFIGGASLSLPILTAKILRKKAVLILAGSDVSSVKYENKMLSIPLIFLNQLSFFLLDRIIVYDELLIERDNLYKYRSKIDVAPRHFLDFNKFTIVNPFVDRKKLIGYIGRFNSEKGVLNFVMAIPEILSKADDMQFVLIGEGLEIRAIEEYIKKHGLENKIKLMGWIDHEEIPRYLNELRLLVLPSYTEHLPNILLEAMACGTPVLSTPVGAVPAIIKDGVNGFILQNNTPKCVAETVIKVLNDPRVESIIMSAHDFVQNTYNFEIISQRYRYIIANLRK